MLRQTDTPLGSERQPAKSVVCRQCGTSVQHFSKTRAPLFCASCAAQRKLEATRACNARKAAGIPRVTSAFCERCGSEMTISRAGRRKWCAECKAAAVAEYKKAQRAAGGTVSVGVQLACKECGEEFRKEHKRQFYCKSCSALSRLEKFPHQEESRRKRAATFVRERRRKSPKWAIHGRMSAGILQSLRDGKGGRHWESLVDYTVDDLMKHLERQFPKGMTWGRRSEFHIDHIIPLSSFSFETADDPEFKAAWSLTNLRPMWATDNIKKSAQRLHLL